MEKEKLDYFKDHFKKQLAELSKQKEVQIDEEGDEYDQATALVIETADKAICERNRVREIVILKALKRIDEGTFGICEECEDDISEKRLLVRPEANTCILCAEKLEHLSKQFR